MSISWERPVGEVAQAVSVVTVTSKDSRGLNMVCLYRIKQKTGLRAYTGLIFTGWYFSEKSGQTLQII
jgi:hypothetical protein